MNGVNRCYWCGNDRPPSEWEQRNLKGEWHRLCQACANRRLRNPLNALLDMRKIDTNLTHIGTDDGQGRTHVGRREDCWHPDCEAAELEEMSGTPEFPPEADPLVQFFTWAAEKGYTESATAEGSGLLAEAFVAGWHAARRTPAG